MPLLPQSLTQGSKPSRPKLPPAATGTKQTIQARHGTATFVPKGHTIKIINTYGRQVVDTWAFALHAPPTEEELEDEERHERDIKRVTGGSGEEERGVESGKDEQKKEEEEYQRDPKKDADKESIKENTEDDGEKIQEGGNEEKSSEIAVEPQGGNKADEQSATEEKKMESGEQSVKEHPEQTEATESEKDTPKEKGEEASAKTESKQKAESESGKDDTEKAGQGTTKRWTSYIPNVRGRLKKDTSDKGTSDEVDEKAIESMSKSWTSYIPSVRGAKKTEDDSKEPKEARTWSSYIPSGHGFSSYIPKSALSNFQDMHKRDPTKSVAEQVYDFSKTPVGAASLSVATGSGYASSIYAAYTAYNQATAASAARNQPGMEFLSMEHTRTSTKHLSPRVDDVLVSNLRAPLLTLVEDTSPGAHDTLTAACDPTRYRQLGVTNWAEHGSCAENLVLALQELNKQVGLRGRRAIGNDVTVNNVPAPLNLFMNVPINDDGDVSFGAPRGKRGDYVRFRAERDMVVVMSACPQDVLEINGRRPMVAHFVVENPSEEDKELSDMRDREAKEIIEKARRRTELEGKRGSAKMGKSSAGGQGTHIDTPMKETQRVESPPLRPKQPTPKPGRSKPRKLERRSISGLSSGVDTPRA